jgi:hypothetical protein
MAPRVNAADVCWDNDRLANPVEVAFTKGETSTCQRLLLFRSTGSLISGVATPVLRHCSPCSAKKQELM